jgi:paraquat-inducible protein B
MSDPTPPALPTAVVDPPRRFRIPLVWVIPIVAALIGLFLAARTWYEQGPVVTLQFRTGTGLEPGKTRIKYKDVDVGQISTVRLAEDGSHVVATAQMAREAAPLLVEDTRFWVVSAKVSGSAVSGLDTLLSGTYVGMDAGKSGEARRDFVGLEDAPVVSLGVPGRSFALHADTLGSIDVGTPVYFRRIQAGQVTAFKLDDAGQHLDIQVFIKSPYDRFVTIDTRFWNASGIDLKLGAEGLQLNTGRRAGLRNAARRRYRGGAGGPGLPPVLDPRRGAQTAQFECADLAAAFHRNPARPVGRCAGRLSRHPDRRGDCDLA